MNAKKIPSEVYNLLNPAFVSLIIYFITASYFGKSKRPISYTLLFLILPLVLPKSIRDLIPHRINSKIHIWINANPEIRIDFSSRAKSLVSFTREGISFALQHQIIKSMEGGFIQNEQFKVESIWENNNESLEIKAKAEFLGKWFSTMEDSQIFSALGVKP